MPKNVQHTATQLPSYSTESPEEGTLTKIDDEELNHTTEASFDKYLKRASTISPNRVGKALDLNSTEGNVGSELDSETFENFDDSEIFNSSATAGNASRNGGGIFLKHDQVFENQLENSTEYKIDVEELFEERPKTQQNKPEVEDTMRHRRDLNPFGRRSKTTYIVRCHNAGTFISSRERWWYIAIANCGSEKGLDIEYTFKMTNGQKGDFWHEHFSADERCMYILSFKKINLLLKLNLFSIF